MQVLHASGVLDERRACDVYAQQSGHAQLHPVAGGAFAGLEQVLRRRGSTRGGEPCCILRPRLGRRLGPPPTPPRGQLGAPSGWGGMPASPRRKVEGALGEEGHPGLGEEGHPGLGEEGHPGLGASLAPIESRSRDMAQDAFVLSITCTTWHDAGSPGLAFLVTGGERPTDATVAVVTVGDTARAEPVVGPAGAGGTGAATGQHPSSGIRSVRASFTSQRLRLEVQRAVPPIGYALLCASWLAFSSLGAMQALGEGAGHDGAHGLLRCVWRATTGLMLFGPIALWRSQLAQPRLNWDVWMRLLGVGFGYITYTGSFEVALDHGPIYAVVVLNNLGFVYFAVYRLALAAGQGCMAQGFATPLLATRRVVISFWILCALSTTALLGNPWQASASSATMNACLISALVGSTGGALTLRFAYELRHDGVDLWFTMALMQAFALVVFLGCTLVSKDINHNIKFIDRGNYRHGIIGWLLPFDEARLFSHVCVTVAQISSVLGLMAVLKYMEPFTVALAMLASPVSASALAAVVGSIDPPTTWQCLGAAALVLFVGLAVCSNHQRTGVVELAVWDDTHTHRVVHGQYVYATGQGCECNQREAEETHAAE